LAAAAGLHPRTPHVMPAQCTRIRLERSVLRSYVLDRSDGLGRVGSIARQAGESLPSAFTHRAQRLGNIDALPVDADPAEVRVDEVVDRVPLDVESRLVRE